MYQKIVIITHKLNAAKLHSWTIRDQNNETLLDFMAQKWNLQTNHIMFSLQLLWRQTPHAFFQNSNASQWESLYSKTGDKADSGTSIKGLKKLSNNYILPHRATFHSTISMCLRQYLRESLSSCVYIYHTFQFVYQRCNFHPRPHISGHCFQITANFPTKVLALLR